MRKRRTRGVGGEGGVSSTGEEEGGMADEGEEKEGEGEGEGGPLSVVGAVFWGGEEEKVGGGGDQ